MVATVGLAFLLYWLLVVVFTVSPDHAALATAVIFIGVGLVIGEHPWRRN